MKATTLKKLPFHLNPTQFIVLGFLCIICIGTFLLTLPISSASGELTPLIDALFTSSSAVCVTGLAVVNTMRHWSTFGQIVIITLIQIGGLGFMTIITMILVVARQKITLKERILIQESLNQNSIAGMVKLVRYVITGTFVFEGIGAVILTACFLSEYSFGQAVYMGIFHSISAFCNAGFDIVGDSNMMPYVNHAVVNLTIMALIVIGGLGFTVWVDIHRIYVYRKRDRISYKNCWRRLDLHSKVVLTATPALIVIGTLFFFLCEYANTETLGTLPFGGKLLASGFQSVTARTAGFNTISQGDLTYASKLMTIILMFIGGSPSGTAGGIKTVTLSVLIIAVLSVVRGSRSTNIYEREIPFETLQKALAIFFISLGILVILTVALTFTEKNMAHPFEFIDLLFEATSALATTGLSTGITPFLSSVGKFLISVAMFMGRTGPISIAVALAKRQNRDNLSIQYPKGKIMVG